MVRHKRFVIVVQNVIHNGENLLKIVDRIDCINKQRFGPCLFSFTHIRYSCRIYLRDCYISIDSFSNQVRVNKPSFNWLCPYDLLYLQLYYYCSVKIANG